MEIVLASASPRRRALLEQIGLGGHRVEAPQVDESVAEPMAPGELVELLSRRKARQVRRQVGDGPVLIAADTVVCLDGAVLGKPRDERDAVRMLFALSGRTHQVFTGLTVSRGEVALTEHEATLVTFRTLDPEDIARYVATGEPADKAGAYGIQGAGALLVERIEGDYFNVMGLPLCRLGRMLAEFGVYPLALAAGRPG